MVRRAAYSWNGPGSSIWSLPVTSPNRGVTLSSAALIDRFAGHAPDRGAFANIVSFGLDRTGDLYILDFDCEIFVLDLAS